LIENQKSGEHRARRAVCPRKREHRDR